MLDVSVMVLLGTVAVSSLFRFPDGMSGAMVLVVIFQVEVSVVLWRFLSCLRYGVVRQNVRELHGIQRLR